MVCGSCASVVDPVWSWCPDCGGLLSGDAQPLDLTAMEVALREHGALTLQQEPYPTEWAQSA